MLRDYFNTLISQGYATGYFEICNGWNRIHDMSDTLNINLKNDTTSSVIHLQERKNNAFIPLAEFFRFDNISSLKL